MSVSLTDVYFEQKVLAGFASRVIKGCREGQAVASSSYTAITHPGIIDHYTEHPFLIANVLEAFAFFF